MTPLPPFQIEVRPIQSNPHTMSLDLAVEVSIATCLDGWILHDLGGFAFRPTGDTTQIEAYMKAHYFPTSGFWASPAAIRVFRTDAPTDVDRLRQAGFTQIANQAVLSLDHVVALDPATGDMILQANRGFLPRAPKVDPDFLPPLIAAARDAGWIARPDGALVNPAHQDALSWERVEDPLPDAYITGSLTSHQPLSLNLANQVLAITREADYFSLEDLFGNVFRATPAYHATVEAYVLANYIHVGQAWINPAAVSCLAYHKDAFRLVTAEGHRRTFDLIGPRGVTLDRFVKAGLIRVSDDVVVNLNHAFSYRATTGDLTLCDRTGNPSPNPIVVTPELRTRAAHAILCHDWAPQTQDLRFNRRFSKTHPRPSKPIEFLCTKAEMKAPTLFPGLIGLGIVSGAIPPQIASGEVD